MDGVGIQQIGRYRVVNVIGEGGMGVVYLAIDEMISRQVAIKMLRAPAGDTDVLARFHREVRSTANLQHKNIVTVYALDDFQGFPYMVMEYLEGQSIANMITSRQPIHLVEKLGIVSQICEGLQYAHDQNVIHRDIKPANILVLKNGTAKIVDFGIARVGHGDTITRTGQIIGSIYWMSPEQISGVPVDSRTDIYSTGVLLFQFLTGSLPYQGTDSDPSGTFVKILNDPVPPLSRYLSQYPRELDDILGKAMAKKAEERYQTAEEFGDELSRLCESLKGEMITEFLAQARIAVEQKDYELARLRLQEVLKADRRNAQANELSQYVRELMQRQQKLVQIEQLRSQAQMALAAHQYEEALECAEQARRLEPENQELSALAASVKGQVERVREIGDALRRGQAALYAGDLQEASNAVQQALSLDQNHTEARTLDSLIRKELEERDRRSKLQCYVEQARRDISNRDFFSALRSLEQAKSIDPTDSNIQELLNWAVRGHEQEKQRQSLQKAIDDVGRLINEAKFTEALDVGKDARVRHPEDRSLAKLCELAERQLEILKRKKAVEAIGASARQLIDENRTAEAIESLQDASKEFPGEPTLETLLAIARSESERRDLEREEHDRRLKALADDSHLTDSRIRERQEVLGSVGTLRSGLARRLPMRELSEIAETLERSRTSRKVSAEVSVEISRALSEFRSRHAKWTKDCEEIRQIKASLSDSKNIEAMEALLERGRLLATQYEKDETLTAEWRRITATAERVKAERDDVASEAASLLHTIQDETKLEKISLLERQLDKVCASWRGDPLIANLINQGKALASDLRERKEQLVRDLVELAGSMKSARSAGQIALIQEHAKMLAAEIQHPDVQQALESLEKCGKQKIEELNAVLTKLRDITSNIETAKSLSEVERYEAAAKECQAKSDSTQEISELLVAIERIASGRRRDYSRTESNLNQLVASASKAVDLAELDLILARARDLLKRYTADQRLSDLETQLETAVTARRAYLASEAASRSQAFADVHESVDADAATEISATMSSTATLSGRANEQVKGRPKSNRRFIMVAVACAAIISAGVAYLVVPRAVLIKTIPAGATVQVDQQSCNSPCTLKLRAGEHSLSATSDGYSGVQRTFSVPWFGVEQPTIALDPTSNSPNPVIHVQPTSSSPEVLIRTSVPGASIFVDGSPSAVGRTDQRGQFQLPTSAGPHYIRVEKTGFENGPTQTITARFGELAVAHFDLKPSSGAQPQAATTQTNQATEVPKGNTVVQAPPSPPAPVLDTFLTVEAPEGSEIHIDQQFVGHSTGGMLKCKVQPGQKTVDVYLAGFQPWSRIVAVDPGAHPTVNAQLIPNPVQKSSPPAIVPTSPASGLSGEDRTRIQQLLDRYATGFTDRNAKLIQEAWPSVHPDQIKKIRDFLKNFKSVKMSLRIVNAAPAGNRVTVDCEQTLSYDQEGKEQTVVSQITLYVVKRDGEWLIDFIPNS